MFNILGGGGVLGVRDIFPLSPICKNKFSLPLAETKLSFLLSEQGLKKAVKGGISTVQEQGKCQQHAVHKIMSHQVAICECLRLR